MTFLVLASTRNDEASDFGNVLSTGNPCTAAPANDDLSSCSLEETAVGGAKTEQTEVAAMASKKFELAMEETVCTHSNNDDRGVRHACPASLYLPAGTRAN